MRALLPGAVPTDGVTRTYLTVATATAAAMAKSDGSDYFKRTSLFWIVSIIFGVGYFAVSKTN